MKKEKKELPVWQVALGIVAALALVGFMFTRGGAVEASKDEIATMRQAQSRQPLVMPKPDANARR